MAQTNYTPISLYYSTTASAVPTAANLVPGELAINTNDGKLYYEDSSGVVQVLATKGGVGTSSTTQVLYNSSGLVVGSAGLTYDGTNLTTTGTATATRFIPSGSTVATNGMYLPAANTLGFSTNSTERMRISSAGNVGIGTSSPSFPLQVVGSVGGYATSIGGSTYALRVYTDTTQIQMNGTNGTEFISLFPASNYMAFGTNNTERMRIDTSGNVGIGVTPSAWGSPFSNVMQFTKGAIACQSNSIQLMNNSYYNGTDYKYVATAGAGMYEQTGGQHVWTGAASGSAGTTISFSERMRIDASGNLLVGNTGSVLNGGLTLSPGSAGDSLLAIGHKTGTASGSYYHIFYYNGTDIGSITQNGTTGVLYNIVSDQRLKTNVVDAPSGNIDNIKVRSFDWIADGNHQEYGMVAQELIEVAPYAVNKPQNSDEMMGVDYSKLVPMMIKEIQDLKQRIATLENK